MRESKQAHFKLCSLHQTFSYEWANRPTPLVHLISCFWSFTLVIRIKKSDTVFNLKVFATAVVTSLLRVNQLESSLLEKLLNAAVNKRLPVILESQQNWMNDCLVRFDCVQKKLLGIIVGAVMFYIFNNAIGNLHLQDFTTVTIIARKLGEILVEVIFPFCVSK